MKIVRYVLILLLSLCLVYCITWYYIVNKITNEINFQYAGKKNYIKALVNSEEYFTTFDKVSMSGFPFEIAVNVHGWKEESRGGLISYDAPIKIGYSFLLQSLYISYNGDIDSAYKPVQRGFGAILKIKDYLIKINIPVTKALFASLAKMQNSLELVNYIKDISVSTKEVQIIDKQEKELFSDKEYENIKFSFVPAKYYKDLQDLLSDIPKEYNIVYSVKTKPVKFLSRQIPVSLFYGFPDLPSDFSASGELSMKTKARTVEELILNSEIKLNLGFSSPKFDLNSFKVNFESSLDDSNRRGVKLSLDSGISLKSGLFEGLFKKYELMRPKILAAPGGHFINEEVVYIINNQDLFKFQDLENSEYLVNFDITSLYNKNTATVNVNNFSIYSGQSGLKLSHESTIKLVNQKNWDAKGVLLLTNYTSVVDFVSRYVYRFGKFRLLNDKARSLYVDLNKDFLKQISDYPVSTSDDLSFDYEINSKDLLKAKIGSVKIAQIPELYKFTFYKKLLSAIDQHGDQVIQIKKMFPDLEDSELENLFSYIKAKDKNKFLQKEVKKVLPANTKTVIE
jgi:hypothetical protein